MSYPLKKALVSIVSTLAVLTVYFLLIDQLPEINGVIANQPLLSWPLVLLSAIPVLLVLRVIVSLVASILHTVTKGREEPTFEQDATIRLKTVRNGFYAFLTGFFASLVSLLFHPSISSFFSFLLGTLFVASIVTDVSEAYYQQRARSRSNGL